MKVRNGFLLTCVTGALLIGAGPSDLRRHTLADEAMPAKAPPAAEPVPFWWFHGDVEVGGRFFLNNPQKNGSAYLGQQQPGQVL